MMARMIKCPEFRWKRKKEIRHHNDRSTPIHANRTLMFILRLYDTYESPQVYIGRAKQEIKLNCHEIYYQDDPAV
jgi:hypothetical protein